MMIKLLFAFMIQLDCGSVTPHVMCIVGCVIKPIFNSHQWHIPKQLQCKSHISIFFLRDCGTILITYGISDTIMHN